MKDSLFQKEKTALREFKKKLLQRLGRDVLELKLFGSKARGDFKKYPDSDIDILILLKRKSSKKEYQDRLNLQLPFFLILEKEAVPF